jgi:hypothetical protein
MNRRATFLAIGLFALFRVAEARAADNRSCDAAYDEAQTLRDAQKLTAAREQLRICGRSSCPGSMVKDCTAWLAEIEPRIPSVVLVANDATGSVVPDVTVSVDGAAPRKVDGISWDVDPGHHTLAFVAPDGRKTDTGMLVLEGQKDQRAAVVLPTLAVAAPAARTTAAPEPSPAPSQVASSGRFPYKPVGYTLGGVGVAGIVLGGVFGAVALATKSSHCPTETTCAPGYASKATGQATISTVGSVAGGILAAGGLTLVVLAPKQRDAHAARVEAGPMVGRTNGVMLSGRWW